MARRIGVGCAMLMIWGDIQMAALKVLIDISRSLPAVGGDGWRNSPLGGSWTLDKQSSSSLLSSCSVPGLNDFVLDARNAMWPRVHLHHLLGRQDDADTPCTCDSRVPPSAQDSYVAALPSSTIIGARCTEPLAVLKEWNPWVRGGSLRVDRGFGDAGLRFAVSAGRAQSSLILSSPWAVDD